MTSSMIMNSAFDTCCLTQIKRFSPNDFQARLAAYGVHPDKDSLGVEILYDDSAEFLLASKCFLRLVLKDHHNPDGLMVVKKNLRVFDHLSVNEDKKLYLR